MIVYTYSIFTQIPANKSQVRRAIWALCAWDLSITDPVSLDLIQGARLFVVLAEMMVQRDAGGSWEGF